MGTSRLTRLLLASASITMSTALAQPAATDAQPADTGVAEPAAAPAGEGDESIVVTARRRSETLFSTPTTVTAVSGKLLRDQNITRMQDIVALIPNSVINEDPESYNTYINIRGIRVVDVQAEPNFGLYRNGLYAGGHRSNLGAQVDIERVEVLRGPQGGLYGRSAVGGAVNIIYATPGPEFGGYARASYASYERAEFEAAVNLPISDAVSMRVTGWYFNQEGSEIYNETLDEQVSAGNDKGLRASLSADLTDNFNVTWMVEYQDVEGPSLKTYAPKGVVNGGILSPVETVDRIRRDTPSDAEFDTFFVSQKIAYDTDIGQFALNASYRKYDFNAVSDSDQTAIPITAALAVRKTDILRDEATESYYVEGLWTSPDDQPFTWIVGVSYFREEFDFTRLIRSSRDLRPQNLGFSTYLIGFPKEGTNVETESVAAFASISYDITDQLQISAGIRWSQDDKSLHFMQGFLTSGNPAQDVFLRPVLAGPYPNYDIRMESTFDYTAPSFGIKYEVNEDFNVYASYSTGFRPGAFNLSPTTLDTIPYGMETAENYEIGFKSRLFDRQVNLNVALFYMRQDDMLLAQTTSIGGVDRTYLANVGTANTYGVEVEASARLGDYVNASLSVGWLDPKFDVAIANPGKPSQLILNGLTLPATREWTVNLRIDADLPINDSLRFVGSAALRYEQGGFIGDYYKVDPFETMTKIDMSAGFVFNDTTRLTVFVDNLLDEHIPQFWYYNNATNVSEGRTAGVQLIQNF